jgi:acyl-coenzyme A synthetase/AMP-(fatty) acid ligase
LNTRTNRLANGLVAQIVAYCRERMAAYKAPASVEFVPELPKSATGKILKRLLRTQ